MTMERGRERTPGEHEKRGKARPRAEPDGDRLAEEVADDARELDELGAPGDDAGDEGGAALVRLNKYLADHGVASRRRCDELIEAGQVTVDGETETRLGTKIDPTRQTIEIDGFVLRPQGVRKRYYLLNKPGGVVCTNEAREMRPRAVDLITDPRKGRIYTVGRLDEESKGLIVLTNDGDFAQRVMHPRYGIEKTYMVRVSGRIDDETLQKVRNGIHLSEGRTSGARILVFKRQRESSWLSVTLYEGMNREIRRVFARVGFKVVELKRTRIGPISDRGLKVGRWRDLTPVEVRSLASGAPAEAREELGRASRNKRPPKTFSGKRGMQHGPRPESTGSSPSQRLRRGPPQRPWSKPGSKPLVPARRRGAPPFHGGGSKGVRGAGPKRPGSKGFGPRGADARAHGPRGAHGPRNQRPPHARGGRGGGSR
jgi:23S rRNA pseudouridine2605 synthase